MDTVEASEERVYALWDHLADGPPELIDQALDYTLGQLCSIFAAEDACWSGVVRLSGRADPLCVIERSDPLHGWRPCAIHPLRRDGALVRAFTAGVARRKRRGAELDVTTIRHAALAGSFRAHRLCDLVPETWFAAEFYRTVYLEQGVGDAVYVSVPVGPDCESYIVLMRGVSAPRFSVRERDAIGRALRGLKWFHRRILLSHGLLIASAPLTVAERKVLRELLAGKADKEIAASLARSIHTTREHVASLYRKFGVSSRAALLALWLGRNEASQPA
ncbi:MAG: helix-turn-helix transcriptional regulator [Polyangiales bacterium]